MELIDKAAVVAEIEKLKKLLPWGSCASQISLECNCKNEAYNDIISIVNSIEVKEVDLEKVIEEYFKGWTDDYDNGGAACHYQYVQVNDCKAIAKHFFELGLNAQKGE